MKKDLNILVEGGILLGISMVLTIIPLFQMPQGGDVGLGALPILIFALRRGGKKGVVLGIAYGLLYFMIGTKFTLQPLSILLDYVIPGAVLGLAGFGKFNISYFLAYGLRFLSYFASGVLIWGSYAGTTNVFVYSFIYNISYMLPEMIIIFISIYLLRRFGGKFFKSIV